MITNPIVEFPPPIAPDEVLLPISNMIIPEPNPNYFVSNYGRIFSCVRRFDILEGGFDKDGYVRVSLSTRYSNPGTHTYKVHRIVKMTFDYRPGCENLQVDHINCNKADNRLCNLDWCDCKENVRRAYANGLHTIVYGEDHHNATITNIQAERVAQLLTTRKYTHKQISEITGVTETNIRNISRGHTHVALYNKYNLCQYNGKIRRFSDEELELMNRYFNDNIDKYRTYADLFRAMTKDILNKECTESDYKLLYYLLVELNK